MFEELRYDEACLFLHNLHTHHFEEWLQVKRILLDMRLRTSPTLIATLIDCSSRKDLSSCDPVVPGLFLYSRDREPGELLD